MKEAARRLIAGLVILASSMTLLGGAAASTGTSSGTATRCGKGYAPADESEEPRARSWHGLALTSMLDVILPPLTEQVVLAGEPKDRGPMRGSGLAKAERGLLAGVLSAAVSAGLAAIGSTLDPPPEAAEEAASAGTESSAGPRRGASPDSCPEGEGSI